MDNSQELKDMEKMMERIEVRSAELYETAKKNGSLLYYFDPKKCKEGEIILLEDGIETIINKQNIPLNN